LVELVRPAFARAPQFRWWLFRPETSKPQLVGTFLFNRF
jgi:hypothetical protein